VELKTFTPRTLSLRAHLNLNIHFAFANIQKSKNNSYPGLNQRQKLNWTICPLEKSAFFEYALQLQLWNFIFDFFNRYLTFADNSSSNRCARSPYERGSKLCVWLFFDSNLHDQTCNPSLGLGSSGQYQVTCPGLHASYSVCNV